MVSLHDTCAQSLELSCVMTSAQCSAHAVGATLRDTINTAYIYINAQLREAILEEIRQKDQSASAMYEALLSDTTDTLKSIHDRYSSQFVSPAEKTSWNSLLALKARIGERKRQAEQRLLKRQAFVINDETQCNASSYASFISAFQIPTQRAFKEPQLKQTAAMPVKPVPKQKIAPKRQSLDLQRKPASTESPRVSLEKPRRRERPKSVDMTISQAALLAWSVNNERSNNHNNNSNNHNNNSNNNSNRKVTPPNPSRPMSPGHYTTTKTSRRYDYVQPSINTQIHLTRVKSSTNHSPALPKKKVPILSHEGAQLPKEPKQASKKKNDDPRIADALENLQGVDSAAVEQIIEEIMVKGEELQWDDIAGLATAKQSLKETVVYPFLRPDLFRGLREPVTGMLLFGPPGTGKTMIAKTVAHESGSTFFSISASSLLSKYLGESEKLIRALFFMAKKLAPSIIFFDEIDSLLTARSDGEHESSRRVKTEFLIQWSALSSATAREDSDKSRVLVLAATNLPWAIDEAARRRFSRRLHIPLPEYDTRLSQLKKLMQNHKHQLSELDFIIIANKTNGYSNSDITALAKEAAMEPIRDLGENLMSVNYSEIRGLVLLDFERAMRVIRKSVAPETLERFNDWALNFGSTGV